MVDGGDFDSLLARLIRAVMRPFIDYYAAYPSTVISQNPDGSLELRPDSPRLPPVSRVPMRAGTPGASATVKAGARVVLAFEGGSAQAPVAGLWASADVTDVTVTASDTASLLASTVVLGDTGALPVARVGDPVMCVLGPETIITGTVGGAFFVGTLASATPLYGIIQMGAKKTRAS